MTKYKQSSGDDKIRRLVDSQEQAIANRSKPIDAYVAQLQSLVKNVSNLFNGFFNGILRLLQTNCANFIKTFVLIVGIIIAVPILFFAVANHI